ncbi:hypothetical protein CR105_05210 [Massilia eurypsychrophila]|jgi:hypothetical protein|uniref:CopC domain-containing protein n=1 Tax=Massilia eurypsychrophila TaxID=1485217 RepID=A0A2G8TK95_9BURK|nr:hypothetical protein [Massilia eurypsychrophila]PIL46467.1 hypothetical protein CR105_05210 [Massilia eurypsychrophila]
MKLLSLMLVAMLAIAPVHASPGAHGPNGEHLDGPAAAANGGAAPRVETFTEAFELVGQLSGGELSVLIDRYETNEPVLKGQLEVQYKNLKAKATFHPDMGDYAFDDARLLKALSAPGKHALLFTLVAGEESDLLEGTLVVAAPAPHDDHGAPAWAWWLGGALLATLLLTAVIFRARAQRKDQ